MTIPATSGSLGDRPGSDLTGSAGAMSLRRREATAYVMETYRPETWAGGET